MTRHKCRNPDCPDCHPEHWRPQDNQHHAWTWPYTLLLFGLLVTLAFLYVSANTP